MHRPAFIIVLTFGFVGAVAGAMPSPARADEPPAAASANTLFKCPQGTACAPIALGDFDGNGSDDVVFQSAIPTRCAANTTGGKRSLTIRYGPFDARGTAARPDTAISLSNGDGLAAVAVADVNGDGRDDLGLAMATRRNGEETQRVAILDVAASGWPDDVYLGAATRGTYRYERTVPLRNRDPLTPSRLSLALADMDADGRPDIVLGIDQPFPLVSLGRAGCEQADPSRPPLGASAVVIDDLPLDAVILRHRAGEERARIGGLGSCQRTGLGGVADVTGDGRPDVVVRRCTPPLPDAVGFVDGRATSGQIDVDGAVPPVDIDPRTIPGPPGGGVGYGVAIRSPGNLFDDPSPLLLRDLGGDGTADIALQIGANTHIWTGGPDLRGRILEGSADRVFVGTGFGGAALNRSWRPVDVDGDAAPDLVLTAPPARRTATDRRDELDDRAMARAQLAPADTLALFTDDWRTRLIVDAELDGPRHPTDTALGTLWALGDLNGDGSTDVVVGSSAQGALGEYRWLAGPLTTR